MLFCGEAFEVMWPFCATNAIYDGETNSSKETESSLKESLRNKDLGLSIVEIDGETRRGHRDAICGEEEVAQGGSNGIRMIRDLAAQIDGRRGSNVGKSDENLTSRKSVELVVRVTFKLRARRNVISLAPCVDALQEGIKRGLSVETRDPKGLAIFRIVSSGETLFRSVIDDRDASRI